MAIPNLISDLFCSKAIKSKQIVQTTYYYLFFVILTHAHNFIIAFDFEVDNFF